MKVYYNDNEPFVAAWLRNLIAAGHLPTGDVDERPIQEVAPDDLKAYDQCHFFAGIGGWAYALQLAGWNRPVWTGSCPCQPFSAAGKGQAEDDPRHLWPEWFRLIRECRPERILGEQVANAIGHGWLDLVSTDLEAEGYAVGACVLGAHSVQAPHQRQRLYFVADRDRSRCGTGRTSEAGDGRDAPRIESPRLRDAGELGHALGAGPQGRSECRNSADERVAGSSSVAGELADARRSGSEQPGGQHVGSSARGGEGEAPERERLRAHPWAGSELIPCRDGKARPVEPSIFPLAHGIPNRMGLLRGAGNSICPQTAAAFVSAYMECGAALRRTP